MKFIYTVQYSEPGENLNIQQSMMYINAMMNGIDPKQFLQRIRQPICGGFLPEDGKTDLYLTDNIVIQNYRDKIQQSLDYLAGYFGEESKKDSTGYLGIWTKELEENSTIYYFIYDNKIIKMILNKPTEFIQNPLGIQYIANIDGNMVDVIPDEGDVLFDNYEEAEDYLRHKNPLLFL